MEVFVNTKDLRAAISAVAPHAEDSPVRFTCTDQVLYVQATSGFTVGMAIVSVWAHEGLTGDPVSDSFDMDQKTAQELLKIFQPNKDAQGQEDDQLRLSASEDEIDVLDVSGLFPGKHYTVPNTGLSEAFPNVPMIFDAALQGKPKVPERLVVAGKRLKVFSTAALAYGASLTLEPTGDRGLIVISAGESFLGALVQVSAEEGSGLDRELTEYRDGWRRRLPSVASAITSSRILRKDVA